MDLRRRFIISLTGGASLLALAYAGPVAAQQTAQADQPSASGATGLEEIVVTARRREEKAQSVPIAMTNFTAATFEEQHLTSTTDFEKYVPGLSFPANFGATSLTPSGIWVRGIPGLVAYFADQPYQPNGNGGFFDVSSVQVLKGPQGTLFGISTNGGAMIIQPKAPTSSFEGFVKAEVGDYGHRDIEGAVNIPVVEDKFLLRVGGQNNHTDGYIYNISNHEWMNDTNYWTGRIYSIIRPIDDIQNNTIVNYYSWHDNNYAVFANRINQFGVPAAGAAPGSIYTAYKQAALDSFNRQWHQLGWYTVFGNQAPGGTFRSGNELNVVNTTIWDLNDTLTVKNILAYQEVGTGAQQMDGDIGPIDMGLPANAAGRYNWAYTAASGPQVQYTEELQLLGKLFDGRLNYTIGTFNDWTGQRAPANISYSTVIGGTNGSASYSDYWSHAVYGQGTYDLSDFVEGLSFTGGYRYTWDRIYSYSAAFAPVSIATQGNNNLNSFTLLSSQSLGGAYEAGSYTMSLDYQITPSTLIYVTNSKGYSRGGVNLGLTVPPQFQTYKPENLNNVEVGIKADWDLPYDVKARTNVSAFYGFYENVQTLTSFSIPGPVPGTIIQLSPRQNAATAHVEGFEWEITVIPTEALQITFNGDYVHPAYDQWLATGTGQDLTNSSFLYIPKWKYAFGANYALPIDESLGKLTLGANVTYTSTRFSAAVYLPSYGEYDPSWYNLDMNLSWSNFLGRPGLDLRTYVTNLTQNRYTDGGYGTYRGIGLQGEAHATPRMWGLSARYAFGP